ncbi:MAG: class I SAM-dependent methyltransferase [Anaerolineales bacterium]|nr:class I SAM-dependent methyltransferase [Anaerolineales bacterium]
MTSSRPAIRFQAAQHELVQTEGFQTLEAYGLYLIHARAYAEAAELAAGGAALDLGCNTGYGTAVLGTRAARVVGVDVSARAIAAARQRYAAAHVTFEEVDGLRLPFPEASFDLVTSFQVIEHVADYGPYLTEIRRVLKPGGAALFSTPNASLRLDPGMPPWNPFHVREFTAGDLRDLLSRYFAAVAVRGLFAQPELYALESTRLAKARAAARRRPRWLVALRGLAARRVPFGLLQTVVNWERAWRSGRSAPLGPAELARFSLADLFYSDADLDQALDLLAIARA